MERFEITPIMWNRTNSSYPVSAKNRLFHHHPLSLQQKASLIKELFEIVIDIHKFKIFRSIRLIKDFKRIF